MIIKIVGVAGGASDDYYAAVGMRFVFTPELRTPEHHFQNKPETIIPSGEEMWEAVDLSFKVMSRIKHENKEFTEFGW